MSASDSHTSPNEFPSDEDIEEEAEQYASDCLEYRIRANRSEAFADGAQWLRKHPGVAIIPRPLFDSLNETARQIETLPDQFREAIEQSSALTLQAVEKAVAEMQERTMESLDAIIAAIPATILRHAPGTSNETLTAIIDEIAEHAMARMATMKAARAIISTPPPAAPNEST